MRFERPQQEAVARDEMVAERLAVTGAGPELLARSATTQCAREEPSEDHGERWVEPDHGVGARPDQIARAAAGVVAVDHPRIASDGARDTLIENLDRHARPVRTPRERVQLDVSDAEPTR